MYNHAPQSENIEAKRAVVYSIETAFYAVELSLNYRPHSSIRHKTSPTLDTISSTSNSIVKLSSTNLPVIALGHEQRRSYVICLRGVLLVVAAYVKRVNCALVSGKSFTLLQIARRELS